MTDYFIIDFTDEELDQLRLVQSEYSTSSFGTYIPGRNNILDGKFNITKLDDVL